MSVCVIYMYTYVYTNLVFGWLLPFPFLVIKGVWLSFVFHGPTLEMEAFNLLRALSLG